MIKKRLHNLGNLKILRILVRTEITLIFSHANQREIREIGSSESGLKGFIFYAGEDREIAEKALTGVSEKLFYAARSNSIPENKAIGISV